MPEGASLSELCSYCTPNNSMLIDALSCRSDSSPDCVPSNLFHRIDHVQCVNGFPGFGHDTLISEL